MLAETLFASSVILSGVVGHYVAKSYLVYQFEKNTILPLALFIVVFMSVLGLLEMLVGVTTHRLGHGDLGSRIRGFP